jgi:peptidoglycan endopeptidase LytF
MRSKMSRRDIIIIAVLVNLGLMAVLFMLASPIGEEEALGSKQIAEVLQQTPKEISRMESVPIILTQENEADEVDSVLKDFAASLEEAAEDSALMQTEEFRRENHSDEKYVEITVKRGDVLSKIAKANGTTIAAIRKANHLQSDQLKIGQVLKIPFGTSGTLKDSLSNDKLKVGSSNYYVVQSGDNPWKIAKVYHISVKELLEMNHMDEVKAKNLKPGDKILVP